jgi:dissimilatory sulfite reductase (desulfoviridin) alpha/beta subunit/TusA-related sulfurtransferase
MGELAATKVNIDELKRVGIIAQKQKDTFLIRLRTVAGDMTTQELNAVSQVSQKYGCGRVHLTTRQAVEIHNIHVDDLETAREELEQSGIVLGVCGPRGRGIVACPGSATCTSGIIETKELAAELDALYFRQQAPHKFKIGVSGCPNNCSKPVENDVGVMGGVLPGWDKEACITCKLCVSICPARAIEEKNEEFVLDADKCIYCGLCINNCPSSGWTAQKTGYTLYLGGTMGKKPRLGTRAKVLIVSKEELLRYIQRAFAFYLAQGRKKERFGHTLDRIGVEKAFAEIFSDSAGMFAEEGREQAAATKSAKTIDLRGVCCPLNFVHAKLAIEKITAGGRIEFFLDEGEPIINVTRSLKDEGHTVLNVVQQDRYFKVLVEKKAHSVKS